MNNILGLWRIPVYTSCKIQCPCQDSQGNTTSHAYGISIVQESNKATQPALPIRRFEFSDLNGISLKNRHIHNLSPEFLWEKLLDNWSAMRSLRQPTTVVAIVGDFVRDRVESKSLPLYPPTFECVTDTK